MKTTGIDPDAPFVRSYQDQHDRKSFEVLYDKYKDGIFNYCYRFFNDEDDAADCTQEVFIRMFRHIGKFRFRSQFSTWLFRIAINTCNSYAASRKREKMVHSDHIENRIAEPSRDPEKALRDKEAGEAFQAALMKLKEIQRSLIILRDLEGKSYEEIARISHLKLGTVRSTLARARYKMAEYLNIYRNGM